MAQNKVEMVTMMKLGGAGNIADRIKPPQMETRQIALAMTIALNGEPARMFAVAAGVMTNAKISNVPTAGHDRHERDVHQADGHALGLSHLLIQ